MVKGSMDGSIGSIVCVNYWLFVIVCLFMKCLVVISMLGLFFGVILFYWYLEIFLNDLWLISLIGEWLGCRFLDLLSCGIV